MVDNAAVVTDVMVAVAAADRLMLVLLLSLFDRCICDFVVADVVVAVAGVVVVVAVAVLVVVVVVVVVALLLLSLIRLLVIVWSTV